MVAVVLAKVTIGFLITSNVNCCVVTSVQGALLFTLTLIITVVLEVSGVKIGVAVLIPDRVPEPETIAQLIVVGLW